MFVAFMLLHILLMMCAFMFYFANWNHSKFKPHLNSNRFPLYKKIWKIEKCSYMAMGRNPTSP
jgi:hypothetical protein